MSDMHNKSRDGMNRRRFITTLATAAGVAPALRNSALFVSPAAAAPPVPSNVRIVSGTLTAADFSFLGAFRVPNQVFDLTFSQGGMTGRNVGGQVQLFLTGNWVQSTYNGSYQAVCEIADPGGYQMTLDSAPRAPLVTVWGDIYQGKRQTLRPGNSSPIDMGASGGMCIVNLLYNNGALYWDYYDVYNVAHYQDWHLGMTVLNSGPSSMRAYGPWRTNVGVFKAGGMLCTMPDGTLGLGHSLSSGNSLSSWGPVLKAGVQFPTPGTAAGFSSTYDLNVPNTYVEHFYPGNDIDPSQGVVISGRTLTSMRRTGDYVWHLVSSSSGGYGSAPYLDPLKNGGQGSWTDIDYVKNVTYINLPTKSGVLFTGSYGTGHTWYGLNTNCGHGLATILDPSGTGPNCTSTRAFFGIYNPATVNAIKAGQLASYTPPDTQFDPASLGALPMSADKKIGGVYFDVATSKLYVLAMNADATTPGLQLPAILVFQVRG